MPDDIIDSTLDTITSTLSSRSSLLLPCDASTRVLELLVLLDQHWSFSRLRYPICFLTRTGGEMLTFVRSMMEWLGGTVSKEDVGEENPNQRQNSKRKRGDEGDDDALGALALRFKHLEFFPNPQALLERYPSKDPKLILAVPASLSHGPSRHLFSEFAAVPDNVVLLTQRGEEHTLGRMLFDRWNNSQRGDDRWDKGRIGSNVMMDGVSKLKINTKVPLQGAELEDYLQKEREAKEKVAAQQAVMARQRRMLEADEDDSDSESDDSEADDEDEAAAAEIRQSAGQRLEYGRRRGADKAAVIVRYLLEGECVEATSFFKSAGGQTQRFRMFPYVERKRRVDEYGETIDVATWLRKGKILEEEAESDEAKAKKREADEEAKVVKEPPSKFVSSEVEIQPACRLLFVDMEGLNDGRAVKHIVPKINPRKMVIRIIPAQIIVHASYSATNALIESCADIRAMTKDIYAPGIAESIQIGQQTNTFSISISDELLASVKMSRFEDNEIGYVRGRVVAHATSTVPTLEPALSSPIPSQSTNQVVARRRTLGSRPPVNIPNSTMIGELKLTALKSRLASVGVHAELIGEGVLVCGAAAKRGPLQIGWANRLQ
ncbi:beta-lactamase protein [Salix suchowensis]|nr:beta-lactamase protein [Salix suchowensis]